MEVMIERTRSQGRAYVGGGGCLSDQVGKLKDEQIAKNKIGCGLRWSPLDIYKQQQTKNTRPQWRREWRGGSTWEERRESTILSF
jgi:hypothetical protein